MSPCPHVPMSLCPYVPVCFPFPFLSGFFPCYEDTVLRWRLNLQSYLFKWELIWCLDLATINFTRKYGSKLKGFRSLMRKHISHIHIHCWRGTFHISQLRPKVMPDQASLFEELGVRKLEIHLNWTGSLSRVYSCLLAPKSPLTLIRN